MKQVDCIIVGAGPCGLSAAIELKRVGLSYLIIEKGSIVNALYHYPTHQTFFSTSQKLEIGNIPFISLNNKPKRLEALKYYREVALREQLQIHSNEKVMSVEKKNHLFNVHTSKDTYSCKYVVMATGYYDQPNMLHIEGEKLPKVFHYFKEAHPYFQKNVVVIGGKNSAVDAAIELVHAGANVTVLYRGSEYSPSVKPWVLPEFDAMVRNEQINMCFEATPLKITEDSVVFNYKGEKMTIENDYVFAMIGYHPDHEFLKQMGVQIDEETGRPSFDPHTMESNVENLYIAGVLAAGNNANEIFIENGRFHGGQIAQSIVSKENLV